MSITTKALLMNVAVILTLVFFYFRGTQPTVLLIAGTVCFAVLNVILVVSERRI